MTLIEKIRNTTWYNSILKHREILLDFYNWIFGLESRIEDLENGGGGGSVPDADATTKGILKLTGDLAGTADLPTVPGLQTKIEHASSDGTTYGSKNGAWVDVADSISQNTEETLLFGDRPVKDIVTNPSDLINEDRGKWSLVAGTIPLTLLKDEFEENAELRIRVTCDNPTDNASLVVPVDVFVHKQTSAVPITNETINLPSGSLVILKQYATNIWYMNIISSDPSKINGSNVVTEVSNKLKEVGSFSQAVVGATSVVVTLNTPQPDTNFIVMVSPTITEAIGCYVKQSENTTTDFEVRFPILTGTVEFNYTVYRN